MQKVPIYTIGHSTHTIAYFIGMLSDHKINRVIDVRSLPASRFNPQYNKKALYASLQGHGISYLHLGKEFGAREADDNVLSDGKVDFEKMRKSTHFNMGMDCLSKSASEGYTVALMCAEADPLACHRFSMISVALTGFDVRHILKDNSYITQEQLEDFLLKKYSRKLSGNLFAAEKTKEDQLRVAYKLLNKAIAYSPKGRSSPSKK